MSVARFRVVIPARYAASRFPGKPLADLAGRPVLEHVWRQARASGAIEVLIATDDQRIMAAAERFGAEAVLTSAQHRSGTERAAEVADQRGWPDDELVVNCQGDAPLVPAGSIDQVAGLLALHAGAAMATLCTRIRRVEDYRSPHVVKVVSDAEGRALYFSRAPIPAAGHSGVVPAIDQGGFPVSARHIGLYAYRIGALRALAVSPPCYLEQCEDLEQLRAMWMGLEIRVAQAAEAHGPDID
ncbi:MAG: 3-deoxy-manno-octulosonate cytidylyltransferase, partial [Gammaproteobacteria bacterium]|nr:3-deoxy-manno-octulosonate cytidylyltransferase [Gammaproteobacteria bacterium]